MFFRRQRDAKRPTAAKETAGQRANEFRWEDFHAAAAAFGLAAVYTCNDVDLAFRRLACNAHPDTGGTLEAFQTLVERRDLLLSHAAYRSGEARRPYSHRSAGATGLTGSNQWELV